MSFLAVYNADLIQISVKSIQNYSLFEAWFYKSLTVIEIFLLKSDLNW